MKCQLTGGHSLVGGEAGHALRFMILGFFLCAGTLVWGHVLSGGGVNVDTGSPAGHAVVGALAKVIRVSPGNLAHRGVSSCDIV